MYSTMIYYRMSITCGQIIFPFIFHRQRNGTKAIGTFNKMGQNVSINMTAILYFAWVDQRDKVCFIFHKVARVLYGK